MKTSTCTLLVNRLFTPLFTLSLFLYTGTAVAFTDNQSFLNSGTSTAKSATIIPVIEYASLVANATEKAVFINWVTVAELNNSHFEVERSFDKKNFKTVALVLDGFVAAGNGKTYKFKEDAAAVKKAKTVYYRLKQVGTDNQVQYSTIMAVKINTTVTVYPGSAVADANNQILLSKQSFLNMGL